MDTNIKRRTGYLFIIFLFWCFSFSQPAWADDPVTSLKHAQLDITPKVIQITSSYHGASITVDFTLPPGYGYALKLEGEKEEMVFNQKGKVGFVWMNVGEARFKNTPQVYLLYSSANLASLAAEQELSQLGLGYDVLKKQIEISGQALDKQKVVRQFFELKEKAGLYKMSQEGFQLKNHGENRERYSLVIKTPSSMSPGQYNLGLYYFFKGKYVKKLEKTVVVEKAGFILYVAELAAEHEAVYGILAVLIALIAGFLIGFIFNFINSFRKPRLS